MLSFKLPTLFNGLVSKKAFNRVNAYRLVYLRAIAGLFTRVVTDSAMNGWKGVNLGQSTPSLFILLALREAKPMLNIFTGGAACVTRRQEVSIARPLSATNAT
jgi:hypothetical protein